MKFLPTILWYPWTFSRVAGSPIRVKGAVNGKGQHPLAFHQVPFGAQERVSRALLAKQGFARGERRPALPGGRESDPR